MRRTETIDVRIPPGLANGARLRVPGKGNSGTMGAPPGDLYLRVEVRPHPFFERRGNDIYTKVPVTVSEATLGAKIEVPTIDGRSLVRIPPGTNSGSTLRLREKGMPTARNGSRGDQYVEIQVIVPKPTDERVRKLMKRSQGNTRLYTDSDLERLDVILTLARDMGVNLAGIEIILNMREKMIEMERQMEEFAHVVQQELSRVASRNEERPQRHAIVRSNPRVVRVPVREG